MLFTGSGRHRRQTQAEKAIAAASVAGVGIALPLMAVGAAHAAPVSTWEKVAECESGGNWSADAGDGYYGGLRLTSATWAAYGGTEFAPRADQATRSQQIAVAERVLAAEGTGAWASCAQQSGLSIASAPGQLDTNDSADETGSLRGSRGAETVGAQPDGSHPTTKAAPVFPGYGGYDLHSGVYWYQKDGNWYWTSHRDVYEQNTLSAARTPAAGDTAQAPATTAPTTPAQPDTATPTDPTSPTATPTLPGDQGDQGNQGNHNGQNGQGATTTPSPTDPSTGAPTTAPTGTPAPGNQGNQGDQGNQGNHNGQGATTAPGATPSTATATTPPAAQADAAATPASPPAPQPYTVHSGDTLSTIAANQNVQGGWSQLYQANQGVVGQNPDLIQPGQVLHLG
ncbi:hypothetical protein GCM10010441_74730 [Kitasatospora paracochleata]|uniref:LysM repeat protein n=1 Tax=Kitasatospora paracochleata TaxID=58354 RepID=A0ABT1J1H3_9ACTN|nr:transglycosylase family protein [Kitasatospora paracochleata]MCP2311223.1 LysM repeat protein [Kitasatospora paracochleata]